MSDAERVDMGSQAEASSSSKRDMGSYISTMKPSEVKALTRKYKIPRDLHPVAVSPEWTMDRLTDEYIGLYEQYFEFVGLLRWKGRFFIIDRRAILDAMCWRHHDSDISDPAPKDGFDEDDLVTMSVRSFTPIISFSFGMLYAPAHPEAALRSTHTSHSSNILPSPLVRTGKFLGQDGSQQGVDGLSFQDRGSTDQKAQAAAKRDNGHAEGTGDIEDLQCENVVSPTGSKGGMIICFDIPAMTSANPTPALVKSSCCEILGPDSRDVSDTSERVVIRIVYPHAAHPSDNGKSIAQEETPMPDPLLRGDVSQVLVPMRLDLLYLRLFLFRLGESTRGADVPPQSSDIRGVAWFTLARGAMAQAHALRQFESLYDTHHALQESLETTRSHLVRTPSATYNSFRTSYNTLFWPDENRKSGEVLLPNVLARVLPGFAKRLALIVYAERGFSVTDLGKSELGPKLAFAKERGEELMLFRKFFPLWAAEVAGSKDTVSLEFSKSKTGPSLQDPVSEHASGGSKAPPSKKT
ncbi:hypothetical protein Tco_0360455 [Tanacetum coccineum]